MCGISAVVGNGWTQEQLCSVVRAQHHRGPDFSNISMRPDDFVGIGHNRLSILDLSPAANQPMESSDGRMLLSFNGELYNYKELKNQLVSYPWRTHSDTEVILAAYEAWGEECVGRMRGMFAFVLWDSRTKTLFAARDRLGIKPLYYSFIEGCLWIASEIKGLLAVGGTPAINFRAVHDYLRYGLYDHNAFTFFDGIFAVPNASTLRFSRGQLNVQKYWSLSDQDASETWEEELRELMHESVRLHLQSDVPIGLHLTGGLDSAVLAGMVAKYRTDGQLMRSFTGTYGDSLYDESSYADQVAKKCDFAHRSCRIEASKFWEIARQTQEIQDEPFGGLPTMVYVPLEIACREEGTVVLLEGQGGDELFGGYAYYFSAFVEDLKSAGLYDDANRAIQMRAQVLGVAPNTLCVLEKPDSLLHQDGTRLNQDHCLTGDFCSGYAAPELPRPFRSAFSNARFLDIFYKKLPRVLRFNDRMSMAFGRELRVPYLDHHLVELAFRIPIRDFFSLGLGKEPLRSLAREMIPENLRLAAKRPVGSPQREWIRGCLSADVLSLLDCSPLWDLGIIDKARATDCVYSFLNGRGDNSFQIWQWINLSLWIEQKINGKSV